MRDRPPRHRPSARRRASPVRYPSTPEDLDELSQRTREKLAALRRLAPAAVDEAGEPPCP